MLQNKVIAGLNIFIVLFFTKASFANPRPEYSAADYFNIEKTVRNAFRTNTEDLKGKGPYKMQVLSQAITQDPDPKKFPFIGYGKSSEEAQIRAALLCMKWQCNYYPDQIIKTINNWRELPAEKFMDYFNALGKLDEYPVELRSDPEKFKDYVLSNQTISKPSCDTFNQTQLTLIYVQCTSVGFVDISK